MTGHRVLMLLLLGASLSGCSEGSFGRFMDHPITSWLPVNLYADELSGTLKVPPIRPRQDRNCYETAKERTEFANMQGELDVTDFQHLFRSEYADCLRGKAN